ncbi:MAG: phosphatidate cytidylyltransferase [Rickettsiales bacterium]
MSELQTRALSAAVLIAAVLFIAWWHPISFATLCAFGFVMLWREWRGLTRGRGFAWAIFGLIYLGTACAGLAYIRFENLNILWSIFAIVWAGDSAAYLVGRKIGRHKIAPTISPGKSWEGLAASVIISAVVGATLGSVAPVPHAILGALFALLGLGGDLFESWLKRRAGVKDSGRLIPGHGGLFDRVDALIPCAIFAAFALYIRLHLH